MNYGETNYGVTLAELQRERDAERLTQATVEQLKIAQRVLGETGFCYSERAIALANVMALNRLEHSVWPQLCSIGQNIESVTEELGGLRETLEGRSPPT